MSPKAKKLLEQILQLPSEEREFIASELYESLDPEFASDAAWSAEIKRRVEELESGTVKGIPWEQVRQKMLDYKGD